MAKRFVIEGEWTGYTSAQRRCVHRTVHSGMERKLRAWVERHSSILYADGTRLALRVRDCKPHERVKDTLNGYGLLIRECVFYDVGSVAQLQAASTKAEKVTA